MPSQFRLGNQRSQACLNMHQQNQARNAQLMLQILRHQRTSQLEVMLQVMNRVKNHPLDLWLPLPRQTLARHSIRPQQHSTNQLDPRPSNNSVSG